MAEFRVNVVQRPEEWESVRQIREEVFVVEQGCPPEQEWDEFDAQSRHFLGYYGDEAMATGRWRAAVHEGHPVAKLERFAVRSPFRGRGFGRILVQAVMEDALSEGFMLQLLHAQAHLEAFYSSFGFAAVGATFQEAGIWHIPMLRQSVVGA